MIHSENVKTGCFDSVSSLFPDFFRKIFWLNRPGCRRCCGFGRTTCSERTGQTQLPPHRCSSVLSQRSLAPAANEPQQLRSQELCPEAGAGSCRPPRVGRGLGTLWEPRATVPGERGSGNVSSLINPEPCHLPAVRTPRHTLCLAQRERKES